MKGGKRGRKKARAAKYSIGIDLGVEGGDFSAYVIARRDPVDGAIEIVQSRVVPAISEEARRIIREDLTAFGFVLPDDAGGSES